MSASEQELFALLDQLGIAHETTEHPPIFTAEEGHALAARIPGRACKNLFLKDKKGVLWLVVLPADKKADLNTLEKKLHSARLSFGNPTLLGEVLGITPGSVTPFALINDNERRVTPVLDAEMMQAGLVNYHPLRNDASTTLQADDLLKFIAFFGYKPVILDVA